MTSSSGLSRALKLAIVVSAAVLLAAISPVYPKPAADVVPPAEARGCNPARPHATGDFIETLTVGGLTREYLLHLPPAYRGADPLPLVLNLHGLGRSARQQAEYTDLSQTADAEDFITVAPQALPASARGPQWNLRLEGEGGAADDVAFVAALLDRLQARLCIDPQRIYATGFSYGGMFAARLACDLDDRITAIAPVAGAYYPPWSPARPTDPPCDAGPVPIVALHATADPIVPYDGGAAPALGPGVTTRAIESEVLPAWAEHNGCGPTAVQAHVSQHVRLIRYLGCDAETMLYIIEGGTHAWPGADDAPPADPGRELSANDVIWAFFEAMAG